MRIRGRRPRSQTHAARVIAAGCLLAIVSAIVVSWAVLVEVLR